MFLVCHNEGRWAGVATFHLFEHIIGPFSKAYKLMLCRRVKEFGSLDFEGENPP